ncbi:MAG: hypothetical protein ACQERN_05210 [Thermodesulfobacteriota bacterium]
MHCKALNSSLLLHQRVKKASSAFLIDRRRRNFRKKILFFLVIRKTPVRVRFKQKKFREASTYPKKDTASSVMPAEAGIQGFLLSGKLDACIRRHDGRSKLLFCQVMAVHDALIQNTKS